MEARILGWGVLTNGSLQRPIGPPVGQTGSEPTRRRVDPSMGHPGIMRPAALLEVVYMPVACFLDVETTGLSPWKEEVVELAMVLFEYDADTGAVGRRVGSYVGLREPGIPISPGAARVHGLTMEVLHGCRLDDDKVRGLLAKSSLLIAHNAAFDRPFVTRLFPQAGKMRWACSCHDIPWRAYGQPSARLESLARAFGLRANQVHRAADDVDDAIALLAAVGPHGRPFMYDLLAAVAVREGAV